MTLRRDGSVSAPGAATATSPEESPPEVERASGTSESPSESSGLVGVAAVEPTAEPPAEHPPGKRGRLPGRDPLWARLLVVFGALLVVLAGSAITTTKVLANRYEAAVKKGNLIAVGARAGGDHPGPRLTGPFNFLLIGSDARADDPTSGQRSDTIIIVHVPASMDRAYLISIPRDLRVKIPPFPATGYLGSTEKINGAFDYGHGGEGGVQLLSSTLFDLTGIAFDGAAVIDFGGFQKVLEELGGVYMCIDEHTESQHIGHDKNGNFLAPWYGPDGQYRNPASTPEVYEPGCKHLDPWQALDYSRQRKSIPDGDYGRQRHQQQLLKAMFDEARRQGIITKPGKLDSLIRSVGASLTVDTGSVSLADLAYAMRGVSPGDLVGIKVPSEPQDIGGISYVIAYDDQATKLYEAIRKDDLESWISQNMTWVNGL